MKNKNIYVILILMFCQFTTAKSGLAYIEPKTMKNYDYRLAFKEQLAEWEKKEVQEKQIKHYEKYGIKRSRAQIAIRERIKLAREWVKNKFMGGPYDISPTIDIFENRIKTMDYIARLGHDRFKRLVNKFGIKVQDDLFQCLCHTQGIIGTGLGYSPTPDKHCDTSLPCKGGNWGCVAKDLPKDSLSWASCAKKFHTEDGTNIFNRFGKHINVSQKERNNIIENLKDRSLVHQKNCLPSLSKRNIQQMQSRVNWKLASKAADLAEASDNICEEAVGVNLFLSEHQSKYLVEVAFEGIATWIVPDELFAPSKINEAMAKKVGSNLINSVLGKTMSVVSFTNNAMANMKLIKEQLEARKLDEIYKGSSELFQTSKTWSIQKLKDEKSNFQKKINEVDHQIEDLQPNFLEEYNKFYTQKMLLIGEAVDARRKKLEDELKFGEIGLKNHYASLKAKLLMQKANLLLKRNIINDYRIPFLEEGGCKQYRVNREASCKIKMAKLAEQERLREEKIRQDALKEASKIPYGEAKTNPTPANIIKQKK